MSHHSVTDRQHQASAGLLVLSHIGRRKRFVTLNKTPRDLQPVAPLELVARMPFVIDTSSTHNHSWPPATQFMQQLFGIPRIWEGEWWTLAVTRGVTGVASGVCKERLRERGSKDCCEWVLHRKALSIGG